MPVLPRQHAELYNVITLPRMKDGQETVKGEFQKNKTNKCYDQVGPCYHRVMLSNSREISEI